MQDEIFHFCDMFILKHNLVFIFHRHGMTVHYYSMVSGDLT